MTSHRVGRAQLAAALAAPAALTFATTARAADAPFAARASVEQVYVTGADPGAELTLVDRAGQTVATRNVNALGGALFRDVAPGAATVFAGVERRGRCSPADGLDAGRAAEHRRLRREPAGRAATAT